MVAMTAATHELHGGLARAAAIPQLYPLAMQPTVVAAVQFQQLAMRHPDVVVVAWRTLAEAEFPVGVLTAACNPDESWGALRQVLHHQLRYLTLELNQKYIPTQELYLFLAQTESSPSTNRRPSNQRAWSFFIVRQA